MLKFQRIGSAVRKQKALILCGPNFPAKVSRKYTCALR